MIKNGTLLQGNDKDPTDTFSSNQSIIETLNSDKVSNNSTDLFETELIFINIETKLSYRKNLKSNN